MNTNCTNYSLLGEIRKIGVISDLKEIKWV